MKEKLLPWLGLLARFTLGGVLLVAGYLKAFTPDKSKMAVRAYDVLPIWLANTLGVILPWLEIGAGILIILGVAIRYASIFGGVLMLLFIVAISQAWARGLTIDCGCFGGGGQVAASETKYLPEIIRDAGLALLALFLIRYPSTKFSLEKSK